MSLVGAVIKLLNPLKFVIEPSSGSLELFVNYCNETIRSLLSLSLKSSLSLSVGSIKSGSSLFRSLSKSGSSIRGQLSHLVVDSFHSTSGLRFLKLN